MNRLLMLVFIVPAVLNVPSDEGIAAEASHPVVYGGMHETLAKGDHRARVRLADLLDEAHFYAVGAVAGPHGEITILDSAAYVTTVVPGGGLRGLDGAGSSATLLVGQTVPHWTDVTIGEDVTTDRFDDVIRDAAEDRGIDTSTPFMFLIEGELLDIRLHVINGACPVHARMKKIVIPEDKLPSELERERIRGTVVAVYAPDAVGKLTHPATSVHAHLIYVDEATGERVTGHLEQVGIAAGATVRLPADAAPGEPAGDR